MLLTFPRPGTTPTHLCTLTVDVFILSNQVRVSCMLPITVSPAIMGFELSEQGSGGRTGFGVYILVEPQGHSLDCDVKFESEQGVTGVASGKTVLTGSVSHPDQWVSQPNIHRHFLCNALTLICGTFILASSSVMQIWQKRLVPTRLLLSQCFHFVCRLSCCCTTLTLKHTKAHIQAQDTFQLWYHWNANRSVCTHTAAHS